MSLVYYNYFLSCWRINTGFTTTNLDNAVTKEYITVDEKIAIEATPKAGVTTPNAPSVTFDDANNIIIGINSTMEYAIDGATIYTVYNPATPPNLPSNDIVKVRVSAVQYVNYASLDTTLTFTINPVTPPAPNIIGNDDTNTIIGMATGMEYNLDGVGYVAYIDTTFNVLDFSGNHTMLVRISAQGVNPVSLDTTLTFTTNIVIPNAPTVTKDDTLNTVIGMALGMEYNLDSEGYTSYDSTTFSAINFNGVHTLLVRVAAEGVNPCSLDTVLNFTVNPITPDAPSVTGDDIANTVTGMALGMEYKVDSADYIAYDATTFNAIDFSGEHILLVRVAAEGINPVSAYTTLIFTE